MQLRRQIPGIIFLTTLLISQISFGSVTPPFYSVDLSFVEQVCFKTESSFAPKGKVPPPLRNIPENAKVRVLKPDPNGGAQYGVEYKWVNQQGQTVRFRVHGPDATAPAGSNAARGPTYRVQVGSKYMDVDGNLYPRNVHNPKSPHYDPAAANKTHIPFEME